MTGRPLIDDLDDFALILFSPAVHHSCLSVEPEPELLEVTEVLTEGVPDVRSRAFRSFRCPTLSPTCHDRSVANIVNHWFWGYALGRSQARLHQFWRRTSEQVS